MVQVLPTIESSLEHLALIPPSHENAFLLLNLPTEIIICILSFVDAGSLVCVSEVRAS